MLARYKQIILQQRKCIIRWITNTQTRKCWQNLSTSPFPLVNFPALISLFFGTSQVCFLKQDELFYGQIISSTKHGRNEISNKLKTNQCKLKLTRSPINNPNVVQQFVTISMLDHNFEIHFRSFALWILSYWRCWLLTLHLILLREIPHKSFAALCRQAFLEITRGDWAWRSRKEAR